MKIKFQDGSSAEINSVPAGTILLHAGDTPPEGYLPCNGAIISRTTYAKLFAKIGTRYGAGDGTTTFALPSTEDRFPRFAGNGLTVGTTQEDAIRNITGRMYMGLYTSWNGFVKELNNGGNNGAFPAGGSWRWGNITFDASLVVPTAEENRPKSIVLAAYIKY
ncbi:MAG: phage tail protein [Synergistaceae bacterium]